jgi:hypothetical protein
VVKEDWTDVMKLVAHKRKNDFFLMSMQKIVDTANREFQGVEYEVSGPYIDFYVGGDHGIITGFNIGTSGSGRISLPAKHPLNGLLKDKVLFFNELENSNNTYTGEALPPLYMRVSNMEEVGDVVTLTLVDMNNYTNTEVPVKNAILERLIGNRMTILHSAKPTGKTDRDSTKRIIGTYKNCLTIFEDWAEIDTTTQSEGLHGVANQLQWNFEQILEAHSDEIERALIAGQYFVNADKTRSTTRGFMNHDIQKGYGKLGGPGAFSYNNFIKFIKDKANFYNKWETTTAYINNIWLDVILEWVKDPLCRMFIDTKGEQSSFGFNINKLITPHGNLELRVNQNLNQLYGDNPTMMIPMMEDIHLRCLKGNGISHATQVTRDTQPRGDEIIQHKVRSSYGLHFTGAKASSALFLNKNYEADAYKNNWSPKFVKIEDL